MGRRQGWDRWKFEDWLLEHRSPLAAVVSAFVVLLVLLFLEVLILGPWHGIGLAEVSEALLATGTVALAYAALVQATSTEKRRRADMVPNLDLQILDPNPNLTGELPEPITQDDFFIPIGTQSLRLRLRNLGPGNAMNVRVFSAQWWTPSFHWGHEPTELRTDPGPVLDPILEPSGYFGLAIQSPISLKSNEDRGFLVLIAGTPYLPPPPKLAEASVTFCTQFVVEASGEDVEGHPAETKLVAARLQRLLPNDVPEADTSVARGYQSRWSRVSEPAIARIAYQPSEELRSEMGMPGGPTRAGTRRIR